MHAAGSAGQQASTHLFAGGNPSAASPASPAWSPTRAKTRRSSQGSLEPAVPSTSVTAPPPQRSPAGSFSSPLSPRTAFFYRIGAEARAQDDERSRREAEETAREANIAADEGLECRRMHTAVLAAMLKRLPQLTAALALGRVHERVTGCKLPAEQEERRVRTFIEATVSAFLYNDLLMAGRDLLRYAVGSFGVVLSHSLECADSMIIGARGQTMSIGERCRGLLPLLLSFSWSTHLPPHSIGFYPELGMVLFGSEQAATKAAMGFHSVGEGRRGNGYWQGKGRKGVGVATDSFEHAMDSSKTVRPTDRARHLNTHPTATSPNLALASPFRQGEAFNPVTNELKGSFRLDLDDLGVSATWHIRVPQESNPSPAVPCLSCTHQRLQPLLLGA